MPTEVQDTVLHYTIVAFIMPIVLFGALLVFIALFQKKKHQHELQQKDSILREQSLIIEKQQAIELERTRIASEMHDDLGSGLTTIRYLSDKALKQAKDESEIKQIKTIADKSNDLVRNMSEIIWAMNSRFDNTENLIAYLRRFASEFLDTHQLPVQFMTRESGTESLPIGGEKRRNIFLVFKEVLNNSVKYSQSTSILIEMETSDTFKIHISELNGKGFDVDSGKETGNGLYNCMKRMETINGKIVFEKMPDSMDIYIAVPIKE